MRKCFMGCSLTITLLLSCTNHSLEKHFENYSGTMVILELATGQTTLINSERAAQRFSPFSTFKIPNSLIALDTEILEHVQQQMYWDSLKYPPETWWPETWLGEHDMSSAIKFSVVPFYRELATRIGAERMQLYLDRFKYGNGDMRSGLDSFWLNGSLQISAIEQIEFLKHFYQNDFALPEHIVASVKSILVQEKNASQVLSYKTGTGYLDAERNRALAWLVGYVEAADGVHLFALNIEGPEFDPLPAARMKIAKTILKELGILKE